MAKLSKTAAIVGAAESDEIGEVPGKSALQHHAEAAHNALADAGLCTGNLVRFGDTLYLAFAGRTADGRKARGGTAPCCSRAQPVVVRVHFACADAGGTARAADPVCACTCVHSYIKRKRCFRVWMGRGD